MTILGSARKWVGEFNSIPHGILEKLTRIDMDEICEITPPVVGNMAYAHMIGECEVIDITDEIAKVQTSDGRIAEINKADLDIIRYDDLPMWGTLWSFTDILDREWLEDHLQEMANCGFRIYEQEDYGYIFGIDGAGYDFYEAHWIPLYKARGLHWENLSE